MAVKSISVTQRLFLPSLQNVQLIMMELELLKLQPFFSVKESTRQTDLEVAIPITIPIQK